MSEYITGVSNGTLGWNVDSNGTLEWNVDSNGSLHGMECGSLEWYVFNILIIPPSCVKSQNRDLWHSSNTFLCCGFFQRSMFLF